MKCLLIPISFISKNLSDTSLVKALTRAFDEVAICANEEYEVEGITFFPLTKPSLSTYRLNKANQVDINSFDDYLYQYNLTDKKFLINEIETICEAIDEYKPDIIYSHNNISAIITAKIFNLPCFSTYSYLINRHSINRKAINNINYVLAHYQMAQVLNIPELYASVKHKFVFNLSKYEPIDSDDITYVGKILDNLCSTYQKNIVVNLPNTLISEKKQLKVIKESFMNSTYQVEMYGRKYPGNYANIHVSNNLMLHSALANAQVFIHDGSNNNIDLGLQYQVGQIIIPNHFNHHGFNADYMCEENCAFRLSQSLFNVKYLYESFKALVDNPKYIENMQNLRLEFSQDATNIIKHKINELLT